ncbi:hypothetical protein [Actinoplanes sp. RD1]|uniref:hypothetical protein n=1 Tax=Actinoplanes sp. RD1 TaxID=3064538 RepID=UPI002741B679|nr:hypothetical protein [Actinoplanes sp. RD1]
MTRVPGTGVTALLGGALDGRGYYVGFVAHRATGGRGIAVAGEVSTTAAAPLPGVRRSVAGATAS